MSHVTWTDLSRTVRMGQNEWRLKGTLQKKGTKIHLIYFSLLSLSLRLLIWQLNLHPIPPRPQEEKRNKNPIEFFLFPPEFVRRCLVSPTFPYPLPYLGNHVLQGEWRFRLVRVPAHLAVSTCVCGASVGRGRCKS